MAGEWLHGRRGWRWASALGVALVAGGGSAVGLAFGSQDHAPRPSKLAAGTIGPAKSAVPGPGSQKSTNGAASYGAQTPKVVGPTLPKSDPVSIDIPSIGVTSNLQYLGLQPNGSLQVPQPGPRYNEAAWYDGSPTPGEEGPSVILGHIDSAATGPSVFFRLGALAPGDPVDVTLADGTVAVFDVTGVRLYPKAAFPTVTVYGNTDFAALRLISCGGTFDYTTGRYLSNTVVFASLSSSHPVTGTAASSGGSAGSGR